MEHTDTRIDEVTIQLPPWQQDIYRHIRNLVHKADPQVQETIKRTNRPYFTLQGNICALQAPKDHVNIFIYDPLVPDPDGIINQGHGNATARSIQIWQGDKIPSTNLINLFKAIISNNRAGGWRSLSKTL